MKIICLTTHEKNSKRKYLQGTSFDPVGTGDTVGGVATGCKNENK
jgi:hypothetical protein